jgi:LuxR family transcriptional regulator, maltose regulon positive regulatory protein
MSQLEVATHKSQRRRAAALEPLVAKLTVPSVRPGIVPRPGLVNRLRVATVNHVVTLVAPAGYGKTTLLSQWAEREERAFAWVTMDEGDDDPVVLLRYVAAALHRARAVDSDVFVSVAGRDPGSSSALPSLARALAGIRRPIVLALDDAHFLRSRECAETLSTLARHVPDGTTLVLSGRVLPEVPVARLRATGRVLEIGSDELALTRRDAHLLLRAARVELEEDEVGELRERTEGWAAGVHLAGLFLQEGSEQRRTVADFGGDDRLVADYFHFEHLSRLGRADVRFLTRSAVLDTMCGPLCDAVLERKASGRKLESLERSSLFVVPLDRRRRWYRYHRLFRDTLRAELERREPELVARLNRRAAAWCEANGAPEAAIDYARRAGDVDSLARLVAAQALPAYGARRIDQIEHWLAAFDDQALLESYPAVAALGSWIHALGGRADEADRWLTAAEHAPFDGRLPDGSRSIDSWVALIRAGLCREGVDRMRSDAEEAVAGLARQSLWRPAALLLCGVAYVLAGDSDRADTVLAQACEEGRRVGATHTLVLALAERSLLATAAGEHALARALADDARTYSGSDRSGYTPALQLAALARAALRRGSWHEARAHLEEAKQLRGRLTHALPWYSVQTSLALARAQLGLLDASEAWTHLADAESVLEQRPTLGVLASQAADLRTELTAFRRESDRRERSLTAAELRLLPLLTTHLSFREIGERLHISRNTVKTQAIAVYRKLGVSSRNDAIGRAAELGLVEATVQCAPPELARPVGAAGSR